MSAGEKEAGKILDVVEEGKKEIDDKVKGAIPAETELPKKKPAKSG